MGMVSRQYVHCSQASFIHALDWLSVCFCICIQVFSILVSLQGTVFSTGSASLKTAYKGFFPEG